MTTRDRRLGLILAACVLALVTTGQAIAALTPTFSATTSGAGSTISYSQGNADDPVAKITFYVPSGFTALLAQPEGTTVGTVKATALAADLGNANLALAGEIKAATGATTITSAGQQVPLSAAATQCTGTAAHSAFWILNLTAAGQTLQVPAFVDDVPLTSPLSEVANNTIQICLPPPDVPAGTPGRATFGAKLVSATLVTDVFSVPPAWYAWHAVITPYTPATGRANAAGTVEVQSVDKTPQEVTVNGRKVKNKKNTATISGRVLAGGKGVSGAAVQVLVGKRVVGKTTSKSGGTYKVTVKLPARSASVTATATAAATPAGTCAPAFAPVPCVGKWNGGFTATSAAKRIRT